MHVAHGIGGVEGLPLPGELVLQTGGVVVLVSFLAVALLWKEPRFTPVVGAYRGSTPLQALMLLLAVGVVAYGFLGPQDPDANPAPRAAYVLLWVGIVPVSLLFGPVWRTVNPLRLLVRGRVGRPLPPSLGYWPAAVGLLAFVWLELVAPQRDRPAVVAAFLLGYALVHLGCGWRYGEQWFARGDAFEVYSTLAGSRPLGRLLGVEAAPGLVAFLAVWWGSTVFDGLTGWVGWAAVGGGVLVDTGVLVGLVLLVAGLYRLATGGLSAQLATTLVPIAAGYTIAHYATLLLVEAPRGVLQLAGQTLGPVTAVPAPGLVAAIQIGAVLVGHVVAVVAAHDRSVALLPEHRRLADQIPLVLLMVAYTMAGMFLLVIS